MHFSSAYPGITFVCADLIDKKFLDLSGNATFHSSVAEYLHLLFVFWSSLLIFSTSIQSLYTSFNTSVFMSLLFAVTTLCT